MPATISPTTTQPTRLICAWCAGTGRDGYARRSDCSHCDGTGETDAWYCGCCGDEYDEPIVYARSSRGEPVERTRCVTYSIGAHRYWYCAACAPLMADDDGSFKREMLRQIREIRALLDAPLVPPMTPASLMIGGALAFAKSAEAMLLDLIEWSGQEATR